MYKNTITACTLFIRFTLFILLALLQPLLTLTLFYFGCLEHEEFKSIGHDWLWEL